MAAEGKLGWEQFAAAIADVSGVQVGRISESSRLIEDLGLDSLALSEVIVFLLVELEMDSLGADLQDREWVRVTVGELFTEYSTHRRPSRGTEFVIHERRPR